MVGVTGEITETRQRERQLDTAKAEAVAAHRDVEQAREIMQTVLDNMSDGVTLFDKDFRWQFSNRAPHGELGLSRPSMLHPGISGREMIRFQIEHGDVRRARRPRRARSTRSPSACSSRAATATSGASRTAATSSSTSSRSNDGSLLGVYRDITELKEREEALAAAKEAAEAARNDVERTREMMQTVLDNMSDGVMLFDKEMRWQFTNRQLMEFQRFNEDLARPGVSAYDILAFQARRGDFGPIPESGIHEEVSRRIAIMRGGARYERRTASGRYIEFTFKPLDDGSLLAIYRDITELKDREEALAAAKEAAEAARDDVERTRQIMQTVLDNMIGGVMLFDKDFRLQFVNRQVMEFQNYPSDVIKPGISGQDILRFQVKRGDFGPVKDVEAKVRERVALMRKPGGNRFLRRTLEGRYVEFNFLPLERRRIARVRPRRHLAEGTRGSARRGQGIRRARARRRRAHARGDADRARQHERRRHAVGQGLPLDVLEPLQRRHVGLQDRNAASPACPAST